MLKKMLLITPLLTLSYLFAQETPYKGITVIEAKCNEHGEAYYFNNGTARIGHITKLSFPSLGIELKPDTSIHNPENPETKNTVVGVLNYINWKGGSQDSLIVESRVSYQNKAAVQEALSLTTQTPDVDIELVVYEYDPHAEKYFKRLHTFNKPVKFVLSDDIKAWVDEEPDTYTIKKPINYLLTLSLAPKTEIPEQKIGFAFRAEGIQFARELSAEAPLIANHP